MTAAKPTGIIELWICRHGRWEPFETFDPASPQFARSLAPADYAFFEAKRQGAQIVKAELSIERYQLRRSGRR